MTALATLRAEPERYELFAALRRVDCAYPDHPRLGRAVRPAQEPLRLSHVPALSFAPGSIEGYDGGGDDLPARLRIRQSGLFGPDGPLPLHLTEYAIERRDHHQDPTFAAFADIFHHRLLGLFYRAWADAQPTVEFDRSQDDRFGAAIDALAGLWSPRLLGVDALPAMHRRHFAGRLVAQSRGAEGLVAFLGALFQAAVAVEEYAGRWIALGDGDRSRLGRHSATLGRDSLLGAHARSVQHRFRLRIGPLGLPRFRELLPGTEGARALESSVRSYSGDELAWEVQLVLRRDAVPATELGKGARLGWTSWVGRHGGRGDAGDLVYEPGPVRASGTDRAATC